jgi:hypothetical protein
MINKHGRNRIILVALIIVFLSIFWIIRHGHSSTDIVSTDSLELANDTLRYKIEQVDSLLNLNKYDYEAKYNSISTQSVDSDCIFYSDYLSKKFK